MSIESPTASLLIFAVGNPSRGDDALGPALLDRLAPELASCPQLECLTDYQLQVEHALDLAGRQAVLFVDAAVPGFCAAESDGCLLRPLQPDRHLPPMSHALPPQALLSVARDLLPDLPPAWVLAIEGASFELGAPLSATANAHLGAAVRRLQHWVAQRTAERSSVKALVS